MYSNRDTKRSIAEFGIVKNRIARFLFACLCGAILITGSGVAVAAPGDVQLPDLDDLLVEQKPFRFALNGYLKNETAYRFDEPRTFTKIRDILFLNGRYQLGSRGLFNFSAWTYHDSVYDLFDYTTVSGREVRDAKQPLVFVENLPQEKDSDVMALRELYLDLYFKKADFRIGKQFVVWGVLEGVRVVDEINPMDFRELILPDLLDYRVPLWTVKADFYGADTKLELLWIPELQFNKSAPRGSEWELFQTLPETTYPENFNPEFSEYGVKLSRRIFDTDISLSYFYTWDDFPVVFRVIDINDLQSSAPTNNLPILPTYTRISLFGLTFSKEIRGDILKGEFAYVPDKYFAMTDVDRNGDGYNDNDGELQRPHIRWGIGYDFNFRGADISPAFTQWIVLDYDSALLQDQFDSAFNLFIRKPLNSRSAVFTLLAIKLINFQETLIKPKFLFDITDHFQVAAGMDIFIGQKTQFGRAFSTSTPGSLVDVEQRAQFFGNFSDNRRIFVEFKYSF